MMQPTATSGFGPGIMYGLPKIHKMGFASKLQYRPILAAYHQASYKISKFLFPFLALLTTNKYAVTNSKDFAHIISNQQNAQGYYMSSFHDENLFTSISLQVTIQIKL